MAGWEIKWERKICVTGWNDPARYMGKWKTAKVGGIRNQKL